MSRISFEQLSFGESGTLGRVCRAVLRNPAKRLIAMFGSGSLKAYVALPTRALPNTSTAPTR